METMPNTACVKKKQRLDIPLTYGKTKYNSSLKEKEKNNKVSPNDIMSSS